MLTRRVVVCLDVLAGRVVKGLAFQSLRDSGDPVDLAAGYERAGADEIVFLDIGASPEERRTMLDVAQRTAEQLFIPLTIGGGIRSVDDVATTLRAGADKVSINSAAVRRPELLTEAEIEPISMQSNGQVKQFAEERGRYCSPASIEMEHNWVTISTLHDRWSTALQFR